MVSFEKPKIIVVRKSWIHQIWTNKCGKQQLSVEYAQILSNQALKPAKLQRDLDWKHLEAAWKLKEYFENKSLQNQ